MVLENLLGTLGPFAGLVIILIFILFIFLVKRAMKILFNVLWISFASFLFPLVLNFFFNIPVPLTLYSFVYFITLGLGLYAAYLFTKIVYVLLGILEKIMRGLAFPFVNARKKKKEEEGKKIQKYIKDMEQSKKK